MSIMASNTTIQSMLFAVHWCEEHYSGLPKVLKEKGLPEEWIYEVMARFNVARRTARDYLLTANAKIKLKEESWKNE